MADSVEDPVYVVLGASGGIGENLSRRLAGSGARLVLAARGEERLNTLAEEIGAEAKTLDATDADGVESCIRSAHERFGRLDGVANLVGSVLLKPAHLTSDDDWSRTLATNLGSAFATVRAVARTIKSPASVVLMSSAAGRAGLPNHEAIAAAKAGIEGLARSAAATYAARGLRFNVVAPGLVQTPLTERITASEAGRKASLAMHPLGRLGEPDDVATPIVWLLGRESSWVTGQVIGVDGGLASLRGR